MFDKIFEMKGHENKNLSGRSLASDSGDRLYCKMLMLALDFTVN